MSTTPHVRKAEPLDFKEQLRLAKSTKQIHSTWYSETYPEVADLGLDPATHYLRYGAAMGRNPGKNFHTRFYLDTYPDAATSGLNPLVHYALHGQAAGYLTRPQNTDPRKQINVIRTKLLSLGFTERPIAELTEIATTSDNAEARALAARELALWHMRAKTDDDYRTALDWIARARPDAPDLDFRSKLSTVELLCHYHLGDHATGLAAYDRAALAGEATPDLTLARVNYAQTPEDRVLWVNQVLARYGIEPVTLLPDHGQPAYDRLTCALDLPKITDGPKVTVLIAAYDAADMLPTALRSLQEQTWTNLEIIVLDDCSPSPDTLRVAQDFAARDPRIQVVRMEQNGGAYVARNHGLDMATGEFVTLHDADDWSHPRKIETQVRFMLDNPEVMGCTSEQARCQDDLSFGKMRGTGGFIIFNTSSFLWRREPVREQLGYWDTVRFGADNEFIRRMQKAFGNASFKKLSTGTLSFQREALSSVTGDAVKGVDSGGYYGVRKEYFDAQKHHHKTASSLKYSNNPITRPFTVPEMMLTTGNDDTPKRLDVVVFADLREEDEIVKQVCSIIEDCTSQKQSLGLVMYYDYRKNLPYAVGACSSIRQAVANKNVKMLVYGDEVVCLKKIYVTPETYGKDQRYLPEVNKL